jgi:DNA repair photolyase
VPPTPKLHQLQPPRGRGAAHNPPNRFEPLAFERDEPWDADEDPGPRTVFLRDATRRAIARNDSPDVGFSASVNPYRGCEHGCVYCYARPTHEYLGFSAGLDFESRILVKQDAPELLRSELMARSWQPQVIAISGVTDPYQPAERRFRVTRGCLEVLAEFRNPVAIITKNHLITRDIDVLRELAAYDCIGVSVSVTSLREEIQGVMEPRTSIPARRLRAIEELSRAGIPVNVMVAPIVPGLTEHEIPAIVQAAADAGARSAGYITLRLPHAVKALFADWLGRHFPERKDKVLNRVRELRDGMLYKSEWHTRMRGEGKWADQIEALFDAACRKAGFPQEQRPLTTEHFRRPEKGGQLGLFG